MATQFEIDCALMAGASYISTRPDINKFPIPAGWATVQNSHFNDPSTGFEAVSFQSIANPNEIVISFAGTGPDILNPDWLANFGLTLGTGAQQLLDAAAYYMQVRQLNSDAVITFTGHSLGGGLAALLSVFFNEHAVTFDPAPFRASANNDVRDQLLTYLAGLGYTGGIGITALNSFTSSLPATQPSEVPGIRGEDNVSIIKVAGEAISSSLLLAPWNPVGVGVPPLSHGVTDVSRFDLHSQALLTTFVQNDAFRQVTNKLTELLGMLFDGNLYYHNPNDKENPQLNFLERLVQHQVAPTDLMLNRFTADLQKIAQDGGLSLTDANVTKALTAFAMQMYYENANATDATKKLFTDVTGGIQFDRVDVAKDLSKAKGYNLNFSNYLNSAFTPEERNLIAALLPTLRDWYVQAGNSGMTATDTLNRGAFMLGGNGADALIGGTGTDLLVGNGGADTLMGKEGNDTLLGGAGADTYVYTTGDGLDTILDSDGNGGIAYDGAILAGGAQYGDDKVHRDANKHLYVDVGGDRMVIDGNILIEGQQAGELGLNMTGPATDTLPAIQTTNPINGDLKPLLDGNGNLQHDQWGNIIDDGSAAPDRADTIYDTSANDLIHTGGGNDDVWKTRGGDDIINLGAGDDNLWTTGGSSGRIHAIGGDGRDYLGAGSGRDLIEGGAGADGLYGSAESDLIYGDAQGNTQDFIAQGSTQQGTGLTGEWVDAEDGDDQVYTGAGDDLIAGGAGGDLIVSGGGNDYIKGDWNTWSPDQIWRNWTLTEQITTDANGTKNYTYDITSINTESDAGTGNDVIYAGAGNDVAFGERGNDVIFGEAGDDKLNGNEGNDVILGGAGKDIISGDGATGNGNDYLDGGEEDDLISGDAGDDIIVGGKGIDALYGGTGQDTYIFNRGDGGDTVYDTKAEKNIFRFGAGISSTDITLRLGSLMLDLGNGDAIHISNFNQTDVFNSSAISSFEFADGSTLTSNELLARGFDIDGTAGDDAIISITDPNTGIITTTDHALYGTNTTDRINGLGGNDQIFGMAGNDTLNGGDGNDQLIGDDGTDLVSGNDLLNGDAGDDMLWGNGGNDTLNGGAGVDILGGGDGNDTLNGSADNDALWGEAGNDTLNGGDGNDQLHGGAGDDILDGGSGDDIYFYGMGDGIDHITDSGGTNDWLVLGNGATLANLRLDVGSLKMVFNDGSELHLDDFDPANPLAGSIEYIQFSDGQVMSREQMIQSLGFNINGTAGNNVLSGTALGETITTYAGNDTVTALGGDDTVNVGAGNDQVDAGDGDDAVIAGDGDDIVHGGNGADMLNGDAGNDTLNGDTGADNLMGGLGDDLLAGGANNDTLNGGDGNDTYLFGRGSGQDVVYDYDTVVGNLDKIQMAADVLPGDVTVRKSGANLSLSIGNPDGTTDTLTLANWFGLDDYKVEQVVFADGTVWDVLMLDALTKAPTQGADNIEGTTGNDVLNGLGGNDTLMGYAGDDTLDGGAGNDSLEGGEGNDTYLFGRGSGQDIVQYYLTATDNADRIEIAADLSPSDVIVSRDQYHLFLSINNPDGTIDKLTLASWFMAEVSKVGQVVFADGTVWDEQALKTMSNVPTEGADVIDGTSGNDVINGLGGDDTLWGYAGDDTLDGGAGNDTLYAGEGNDTYVFGRGSGQDFVYEYGTAAGNLDKVQIDSNVLPGEVTASKMWADLNLSISNPDGTTDTLRLANWFGIDAYVVEQVVFADGTVWDAPKMAAMANPPTVNADVLYGSSGNDVINGLGGNDVIYGLTGDDTLTGGTGDATLYGGDGNDVLTSGFGYANVLDGGNGNDLLDGRLGWYDTISGGAGDDTILGGAMWDTLSGGGGNDLLVSGGGGDTMLGGAGDDTYVVGGSGDIVTEFFNQGIDQVQSSGGFVLGANIENLTLTGIAAINGTGNALDNTLIGNSAKNTLIGNAGNDILDGGAGVDTMQGGVGDDTYMVDSSKDVVTENLNEGVDTVQSNVTYTLGANIETLLLTGISSINGTGNTLNNVLTGNNAANTLTGGAGNDRLDGKAGADKMLGGAGDDTYLVDASTDVITERRNEGIDTVETGITYTLKANLENLILTGTAAINGTDNTLNNLLTGNSAANNLIAGTGNDILQGGVGNDVLQDTAGNNLLNGGADTDVLTGGTGNEIFIGGTGNDTISTGSGADLIAFNRGDGVDTVNASTVADNTLSLGGGIQLGDLSFTKSANNLILNTGNSDQIILKDWYANTANRSFLTLQMIEEAAADFNPAGGDILRDNKIETFNFQGLADRFDQAVAANPGLTSWALTQALMDFHLAGSDSAALGGDLAYQYGNNGNLSNVGLAAAQAILSDPAFGTGAQALTPLAGLQEGALRLS